MVPLHQIPKLNIMTTENLTDMAIELKVSEMAENLVGSEIIKLAGDVRALIAQGKPIMNYTIGDFDSGIFPIPDKLKSLIINAYKLGHTNYPPANGIAELRQSVSSYLSHFGNLNYHADQVLIAGGARPLIYAAYQTIVNPGDMVIFPVPSWNNNHYTHLSGGEAIFIETTPENKFMPTAESFRPYISKAHLIAVCSPLNPTGTTFTKEGLAEICELILEENKKRQDDKPVYLLFDQIYWMLKQDGVQHFDPVSLYPEMKHYTIYIDGISKAFAATGVRVGWAFGPDKIINKMKAILGHIGAWSPKAEQFATAEYLNDIKSIKSYHTVINQKITDRINGFYQGFIKLKQEGFAVDVIKPEAAMYLTVKIDLKGKSTTEGKILNTVEDTTKYILEEAHLAIVPFKAFGASTDSCWYRLSVGTCKIEEIGLVISKLRSVLSKLI